MENKVAEHVRDLEVNDQMSNLTNAIVTLVQNMHRLEDSLTPVLRGRQDDDRIGEPIVQLVPLASALRQNVNDINNVNKWLDDMVDRLAI